MRIQHNIAAMNSYRNYTGNNNALARNLEKLSSGYKINRAGDDAAGLAISEKMRAQIAGLSQAQSNVKDGISLVKTAEGALQEVQDMMNRMVTLATQSANGTYQNEVDRENLQAEVEELKKEINRIADSSNYNGQKLLNGELSATGVAASGAAGGAVKLETELNGAELVVKDVAATKGSYQITVDADNLDGSGAAIADGSTVKFSFSLSDGTVQEIQLTMKDYTDGTAGGELIGADGTVYGKYAATGAVTDTELGDAMRAAMKDSDLAKNFKFSNAAGVLTLSNVEAGADAAQVLQNVNVQLIDKAGVITEGTTTVTQTKGEDAYQTIDASQFMEYDGTDDTVLNINGKKFAILAQDGQATTNDLMAKAMEAGLEVIMVASNDGSDVSANAFATNGTLELDAGDADPADTATVNAAAEQGDAIAAALSKALGYKVEFNDATVDANGDPDTVANFSFKIDNTIDPDKRAGGGLTLQIGDTAEDYNQLTVNISDMHTKALGIDGIDISGREGAAEAIQVIKDAINQVSSTRGNLGAIQNRLEHTQNNLSVMTENITDAESTIRDTDIADEMTTYTKNNILLQSAQAMLAQANQMPQGVLQLLQ